MNDITPPEGFRIDRNGDFVAVANIKPIKLIEDQCVAGIADTAKALRQQMKDFKLEAMAEVEEFVTTVCEQHNAKRRSKRGDAVMYSFDGRFKVEKSTGRLIEFNTNLEAARLLFGEYLDEKTAATADNELRTLVNSAFNVAPDGSCNTSNILKLLQYEITNPKWLRACDALREAIDTRLTKSYIRVYERDAEGNYLPISLDLAKL